MVTSGGVRLRQLVVVTVVVGLLGLVVLRLLGGTVPSPGWPGVVLLLFMAVGVYFAALPVKRLRERRGNDFFRVLFAMRQGVRPGGYRMVDSRVFRPCAGGPWGVTCARISGADP